MSLSMYSASVPVFQRMLANTLVWLDKAEAHAAARKFGPDAYLALRLAPDMLPFTKQIQIASDNIKGCVARLAGQEVPKWDDTETTMADLRVRIRRTIDFIGTVPASAFEGAETREIVIPLRNRDPLVFSGANYLNHFALPNVYFHLTMTYALLRQAGVEVGKGDFLGS